MTLRPSGDAWRSALRSLDRPPDTDWRSLVVHHGVRVLVLLLAAAVLPVVFPRSPLPRSSHLEEGMVAEEDVIAEVSFPVTKSDARLAEERREAERGVLPVFTLDPAAADSSARRVRTFFAALDSAASSGADTAGLRRVAERRGLEPGPGQLRVLADRDLRQTLERSLVGSLRDLLPGGVAPGSHLEGLSGDRVVVRGPEGDHRVERDSLSTLGAFYERAGRRAPEILGAPGLQLYQALAVHFTEPTLRLDRAATEAARRQAREAVETTAGHVLQGERIVAAHERVGAEEMEKLEAYREELQRRGMADPAGTMLRSAGAGLYGLGLLAVLGLVLFHFRPGIYEDLRGFGLVVGLTLAVPVAASTVAEAGTSAALVPVAFAALLVGALYDGLLALIVAGVVAGLLAAQPPFAGTTPTFLTMAAGAAAAFGVRGVRRRTDSWILIALIAGAYTLGGAALGLMLSLPVERVAALAGWGTVNATACTLLAVAVLPALETFTGITTEQTLLELSDLNRPILRRLSREAPGTYAHSINVANLSEAACSAIGADALLARAGTYYHDIGKMARPQFFIENQPVGRNPHDRIPPEKSVEVIRGHVTEGLRMAREARLPETIRTFIREHHGTTTIGYFLEKARRNGDEEPDPADFRYPGPKPHSRETAVVMLADGVESAARTLADPSPERIRELIDGIVEARLESGQLEESPLTLRDLDRIKREFARVLTGVYHHRVDYPGGTAGPEVERDQPEAAAREGAGVEESAAAERA